MWPPENIDDSTISIPSVLLAKVDAVTLMKEMKVGGWNGIPLNNIKYPTPQQMGVIFAKIEWGLPHPDDKFCNFPPLFFTDACPSLWAKQKRRVDYEIWTSSNDKDSVEFKKNFKQTAIDLDKADDTVFTPLYYVLNGTEWGCDSADLRCGKQCSNSGRYCAARSTPNMI